jgi:tRNA threonylcarbamoyladenosine modification (KEOPS) complex  Pcc1 subunit
MRQTNVFEETIGLQPSLSGLSGKEDISSLMSLIEDYYEFPIFQSSPDTSDFLLLSGNDEVLIDGSTPTVGYFDGSNSSVKISSGKHDFILNDSTLTIDHTDGSTALYIDDFSAIDVTLNIQAGDVSIYSADSTFDLSQANFTNGRLFYGDDATNIVINNLSENGANVRIISLDDEKNLDLKFEGTTANIEANLANEFEESSPSMEAPSEILPNSAPLTYTPELSDIFYDDDVSFDRLSEPINSGSSMDIPDELISDIELTDEIDLLYDSLTAEVNESIHQISNAELNINQSIDFDSEVLISIGNYSELSIEDPIDYIDDI